MLLTTKSHYISENQYSHRLRLIAQLDGNFIPKHLNLILTDGYPFQQSFWNNILILHTICLHINRNTVQVYKKQMLNCDKENATCHSYQFLKTFFSAGIDSSANNRLSENWAWNWRFFKGNLFPVMFYISVKHENR